MERDDELQREDGAGGSLRRRTVVLAVAIAALTGAALLAVWRATEPGASARTSAEPVTPEAPATDGPAAVAPSAAPLPPGAGIAAPPEWRAKHPTVPVPVPNQAPPIAAPPPDGIPSSPAEREDAIVALRRKRYAEQIQQLNRRTAQHGGVPADAGARPPPVEPRPGTPGSRRSSLSPAE